MSTSSFTLRRAVPADAAAILDAHRDAVRGTATGYYAREIIEEWAPLQASPERVAQFARAMAKREEIVVVAVDATGSIMGFGSIVPQNGELRAVYVRSSFGRRGVGGAILRRLEELARDDGVQELRMDASINAEAFYRAHGFSAERAGEHRLSSGARMACIHMRKSL